MEEKNGYATHGGFADGSISIKMALQQQRGHCLDTSALFVDLVKAFDSILRNGLYIILTKKRMVSISIYISLVEHF